MFHDKSNDPNTTTRNICKGGQNLFVEVSTSHISICVSISRGGSLTTPRTPLEIDPRGGLNSSHLYKWFYKICKRRKKKNIAIPNLLSKFIHRTIHYFYGKGYQQSSNLFGYIFPVPTYTNHPYIISYPNQQQIDCKSSLFPSHLLISTCHTNNK